MVVFTFDIRDQTFLQNCITWIFLAEAVRFSSRCTRVVVDNSHATEQFCNRRVLNGSQRRVACSIYTLIVPTLAHEMYPHIGLWPPRTILRTGRHCVFLLHAHLVFVTKYRHDVFSAEHLTRMEQIMRDVAADFECEIVEPLMVRIVFRRHGRRRTAEHPQAIHQPTKPTHANRGRNSLPP